MNIANRVDVTESEQAGTVKTNYPSPRFKDLLRLGAP